jgi:hypothetical protein
MTDNKYADNTSTDLLNGLLANTEHIKDNYGIGNMDVLADMENSESVEVERESYNNSPKSSDKFEDYDKSPKHKSEYFDDNEKESSESTPYVKHSRKENTETVRNTTNTSIATTTRTNNTIPKKGEMGTYLMDIDEYNRLDPHMQKMKKIEIYSKLSALQARGIKLTKSYSLHSSYEEMCIEYESQKNIKNKQNATSIAKKVLVAAIGGLEFLNKEYDPFGLDIEGMTDQLQMDLDDDDSSYEEVLGELYDKYKGRGRKMEPELKLLLMLGGSAASIHLSKKMKTAGLDQVIENNPEILAQLRKRMNKTVAGPSQKEKLNEERMRQQQLYQQMQREKQERERLMQQNTPSFNQQLNTPLFNQQPNNTAGVNMNPVFGGFSPQELRNKQDMDIMNRRVMKRPSNTDDIINNVKQSDRISVSSSSSNNRIKTDDDVVDSASLTATYDTITGEKKKVRRRKKLNVPVYDI